MTTITHSYMGKGPVSVGPVQGTGPIRHLGNSSSLNLAISQAEKKQIDYDSPGGGTFNKVTRIDSVAAEITVLEISPKNVALGMRGVHTAQNAAQGVAETLNTWAGGRLVFSGIPDTAGSISAANGADGWDADTLYAVGDIVKPTSGSHVYRCTVAGTSDDTTEPTWPTNGTTVTDGTVTWLDIGAFPAAPAEGTDFFATSHGVVIPDDTGFPDGCPVTWTYNTLDHDVVEALTAGTEDYTFVFEGLNEAESDRVFTAIAHRFRPSPTDAWKLKGDEYGEFSIKGELLSAAWITTPGLSKYLKFISERPAA